MNYNNNPINNFRILSDRTINNTKTKNKTLNRLTKNHFSNIDNPRPNNLKLLQSGKREKDNENVSKLNTIKIIGKFIKENGNKNSEINGLTENGNNNIIFKNTRKYHIKKLKNKPNSMITIKNEKESELDKKKIKQKEENLLNKINGQKELMKKINIFNMNRTKSYFFGKKANLNSNEFDNKYNNEQNKKNNDIFIYTKHYGDHNKCPMCQSMEMKAKFSENKIGLYEKYNKHRNEEAKLCSNHSNIKSGFLPSIKVIEDKKEISNNISIKKEILSPINLYTNHEPYFRNTKEKFAYNILRNKKGKIEKLGINDFPVLDKYFNS